MIVTSKPLAPRRENDFYPSPLAVCQASMGLIPRSLSVRRILDPGCGTGVWGEAARAVYELADIDGVELRADALPNPAYTTWRTENFLTGALDGGYDLVIGNPPYGNAKTNDRCYAERFVRRSLSALRPGGMVLFLLRLAFLEGQERGRGLFAECPPLAVHVLVSRPSFMPEGDAKEGKTDSTAYAVFVWQKGYAGQTTLGWLDWQTPKPRKKRRDARQPALFSEVA